MLPADHAKQTYKDETGRVKTDAERHQPSQNEIHCHCNCEASTSQLHVIDFSAPLANPLIMICAMPSAENRMTF
jgi:hypothetical protein